MKPSLLLATLIIFIASNSATHAAELPIGSIKTTRGSTQIVRENSVLTPQNGTRLQRKDILITGATGSLAVVFKDDTVLAMGPGSKIVLEDFAFSPAEGKLSFITRMLRGTASYMSGIIAKLAPESVRFETPVAHIGIRGTRFAVRVEEPEE